jgi:hypothetical protein
MFVFVIPTLSTLLFCNVCMFSGSAHRCGASSHGLDDGFTTVVIKEVSVSCIKAVHNMPLQKGRHTSELSSCVLRTSSPIDLCNGPLQPLVYVIF